MQKSTAILLFIAAGVLIYGFVKSNNSVTINARSIDNIRQYKECHIIYKKEDFPKGNGERRLAMVRRMLEGAGIRTHVVESLDNCEKPLNCKVEFVDNDTADNQIALPEGFCSIDVAMLSTTPIKPLPGETIPQYLKRTRHGRYGRIFYVSGRMRDCNDLDDAYPYMITAMQGYVGENVNNVNILLPKVD